MITACLIKKKKGQGEFVGVRVDYTTADPIDSSFIRLSAGTGVCCKAEAG